MNSIIVIPTYNEKNNIRLLSEEILKLLPDIRILFVDDNSPDGTGIIADELGKENSQIKVLHRKNKDGLGRAYIAGFKEALRMDPDYIIQMDADFSHQPKYIPLFLKEINSCDLVLGSRFLNIKRPINVTTLSRWGNRYAQFMTGMKISDPLGGFKCFHRKVLEAVELDKFISSGFIFQVEFLYRALKLSKLFLSSPIAILWRNHLVEREKTVAIFSKPTVSDNRSNAPWCS